MWILLKDFLVMPSETVADGIGIFLVSNPVVTDIFMYCQIDYYGFSY